MWLSIIVADSTRVSHCLPMWDAEKHPWYRNTRFISCLLVVGSTISHGCSSGWLVCTTRISIQRLRGTMDTDASIMPDCAKSLVWSDSFFSQSCTLIKEGWIVVCVHSRHQRRLMDRSRPLFPEDYCCTPLWLIIQRGVVNSTRCATRYPLSWSPSQHCHPERLHLSRDKTLSPTQITIWVGDSGLLLPKVPI